MDRELSAKIDDLRQQVAELGEYAYGAGMQTEALTEAMERLSTSLEALQFAVQGLPLKEKVGRAQGVMLSGTDVTEGKQALKVLQERTHELGERVKELNCLYGISALVMQPGISLPEILLGTAELLPPAWQYPETSGARVTLGDQQFRTESFSETAAWRQAAEIIVHGQQSGSVEVCYLEERPEHDEGPFLKEERTLLNAVAERLGRIIERMCAMEALRESEETARALINAPTDLAALIDPTGLILDANETMAQRFGRPVGELVGTYVWDLLPPDVASTRKANVEQVIRSGEPLRHEDERQGTWNDDVLYPVLDADGKVAKVALISRDITERKQAEQLQKEQNRFVANLFESLAYPFYVIDANDYSVKMANSAALRGESPATIPCYTLLHGRSTPCGDSEHCCPLEEIKKTREAIATEHLHYDTDGSPRVFEVHGHPVFDDAGEVTEIVEYALDITERKQAENALRQSERDLRVRNQINSIFLTHPDERMYAEVLKVILDVMESEFGTFGYFDESGSFVAPALSREIYWEQCNVPEKDIIFQRGTFSGIWRRAIEERKTHISNAGPFSTPKGHIPIKNTMVTPVIFRDQVISAIHVANKPGGYDEGDRVILETIADQIAPVLYARVQRDRQDKEREQAEKALLDSEKKYRQLIELAQEGVWTIDDQAFTSFVNPRMAEMLGYDVEEMQGRHLFSFMDERGAEAAKRNLERRRQGITEQHDFEFLRKDGSRIYTSLETSPLTDENGNYIGALALVADITERRRAEEALRKAHDELELRVQERTAELVQINEMLEAEIAERQRIEEALRWSEERFRQLAENINEVFWMTDVNENRILYVSPAYERLWGHSRESLYEQTGSFLEAIHPEDRARVAAVLQRQSQAATDATYRIVRPDAIPHWIRARTFPVRDDRGEVYRVAGIAEDITERVEAYQLLEQRVEERTRELSTLLEISRQVALTTELNPLLDLILDQLRAVVGYDDATIYRLEGEDVIALAHQGTILQEEMLQHRFSLANAPLHHQVVMNQEPIMISDVHGDTPLAQDFRRVTGERFNALYGAVHTWMGVPLKIKDQVVGLLTLKHSEPCHYRPDQVDLVQGFANQAAVAIENTRLYKQAQELAAVEERQRLARDLHDAVSQTLFSASLAAEVLPRLWENKRDEGRRCLKEVQQLTRGALAEMRTLLLELRPSGLLEVGLDDLLHQLVEAASGRARIPITLRVEGQCSLTPDLQVNLYRIAQEGLSNIAKHAEANQAEVSLLCVPPSHPASAAAPSEKVELHIRDDGSGFDPECVAADCLGLRIMDERAEAIGAALTVDSHIGQGTRLQVIWPARS